MKEEQTTEEDHTTAGVALCVHNYVVTTLVALQRTLQAVAVSLSLWVATTECSLYMHPVPVVSSKAHNELNAQFPKPFTIMGDFNALNLMDGFTTWTQTGLLQNSVYS